MKKSIYAVIAAVLLLANISFAIAQTATVPSVNSLSNRAATYRAVITGIATASTPTDIFRISGSATKTVYIKSISVNGVKTTSGTLLVNLIKRSTANSDGTTVAITEHPLDSGSAAATAVAVGITANMTVGTGVIIGSQRVAWLSNTAAATPKAAKWEWGDWGPNSFVVLRGVAQGLAINLDGVTQTGGSANVEVEWMEM